MLKCAQNFADTDVQSFAYDGSLKRKHLGKAFRVVRKKRKELDDFFDNSSEEE